MNVAKSSADRPVPPCRTIGRSVRAASSRTRSGQQDRLRLVLAVRGAQLGRQQVDAGALRDGGQRRDVVGVQAHVGADAVLDADDVLDLRLDVDARGVRLRDHLGGLPLGRRPGPGPRRRRAPTTSPARTTSEMTARSGQWSRCSAIGHRHVGGGVPEHRRDQVRADRADGLDGDLDDQRRRSRPPRRRPRRAGSGRRGCSPPAPRSRARERSASSPASTRSCAQPSRDAALRRRDGIVPTFGSLDRSTHARPGGRDP